MNKLWLPLAFLSSAVSFPAMLFERALPRPPDPDKIKWEEGSLYHNLKNQTTEYVRADAQYWSKLLWFIIFTEGVVLLVKLIL